MEDFNWETIFTDNIGHYSTNATDLAGKEMEIGEKRKIRDTPFLVIEVGTNRKPVCDFLLVINSN